MTRENPIRTAENTEHWKVVERKGHHKPNSQRGHHARCGCPKMTEGGYAYRDVVLESTDHQATTWDRIRYYHGAPVVQKNADCVVVRTHGYGGSSTTRQRINEELPKGFQLVQRDFEVLLRVPTGDLLEVPDKFKLDYSRLESDRIELLSQGNHKIADLLRPRALNS